MSIHTPLEERQKNGLEGAVPSEYMHDVKVTCDASSDFQYKIPLDAFLRPVMKHCWPRQLLVKIPLDTFLRPVDCCYRKDSLNLG